MRLAPVLTTISALLCCACAWSAPLSEEDIALNILPNQQSQFYNVRMNAGEKPYLNIEDLLVNWFGLRVQCDVLLLQCHTLIPPDGVVATIDGVHHQLSYGKLKSALPRGALVLQDGKLWLSYTALARWLPMTAHWNLQQYRLTLVPQFKTPLSIKRAHDKQLLQLQAAKQSQMKEHEAPLDKPKAPLSIESRYRFDWALDQNINSRFGVSSETHLDVLKGTLYFSGARGYDFNPSQTDPFYWNYSITKPGKVHLLRVGHTETENGLLLPYLTLKRAFEFERLPPSQGSGGGFQYVGRTMPATEVDVYRNGVLLDTQVAQSDGSYRINTPAAVQGDIYTIKFYFRDGTHSQKQIVISADYGLVLAPGQTDVQLVTGEIDRDTTPRFTHVAWRYGLFNNFSIGAHVLGLPSGLDHAVGAGMLDVAWRPKPWADLLVDAMQSQTGMDYAAESNLSYFNQHTIRLQLTHINDDSPIIYTRSLTPLSLLQSEVYDTDQSWSIQDIYSHKTWRFSTQFIDDIAGRTVNENITGNLSDDWSITSEYGYTWSKQPGAENQQFLLGTLNYRFSLGQLISLSHLWQSSSIGSTVVSYRLQGNGQTAWDALLNCEVPSEGRVTFYGTLSWRAKKHWMLSASFDNHSVNAVLTFQGIFGSGYRYRSYRNFGSGSVEGYVMAPKQNGQLQPLAGVEVSVAGNRATTDKDGHYFITGVPVNEREIVRLRSDTVDARYLIDDKVEAVEVRPGTIVHYNPVLRWAGGIDGYVVADGKLDKGVEVLVKSVDDGAVVARAAVESDGFFVFDRLPVGHYILELNDKAILPAKLAKRVEIPQSTDWLSGVNFDVTQLQLAQGQGGQVHG